MKLKQSIASSRNRLGYLGAHAERASLQLDAAISEANTKERRLLRRSLHKQRLQLYVTITFPRLIPQQATLPVAGNRNENESSESPLTHLLPRGESRGEERRRRLERHLNSATARSSRRRVHELSVSGFVVRVRRRGLGKRSGRRHLIRHRSDVDKAIGCGAPRGSDLARDWPIGLRGLDSLCRCGVRTLGFFSFFFLG